MIERKVIPTAKIGIFAVGHAVYWQQFEGLLDSLMGYHSEFQKLIEKNDVQIIDFGMIDSSEKAFAAVDQIQAAGVDILFCNMATYATSSVFAPIVQRAGCPIVLTALQPLSGLDYSRASTYLQLENDNICSVPEFTGVAVRLGKPVADVIIGTLHQDAEAESEIAKWCAIAKVLNSLKGARIGLMGHVLEAMYDMHADPTALSAAFGIHLPLLEIEDVIAQYELISPENIREKIALIESEFDMPDPASGYAEANAGRPAPGRENSLRIRPVGRAMPFNWTCLLL